ncbi:MAG: ATP-binding protein [Thermofilum sp.]|nr:ATP-binding protein [Thermofilum sp.]
MESQNPWWRGREAFEEDDDYRKWKHSSVKWIPRLLEEIELKAPSLQFLYGPRQVGKTTLLKLLARKLLEEVDNPRAVFYYRCDLLADYKELDSVLSDYLKIKKNERIRTSYILLDEVTFPKEWYRSIKYRVDSGDLKDDVLILTGSLSMFVKGEVETFPGRRGSGKDYVLYPLSFREYVRVARPDIYGKLEEIREISLAEIREKCFKLLPWRDQLNEVFESYLEAGGFPLAVKSYVENGKVLKEVKDAYLSAFLYDLAKLRRSEAIAKRVLKAAIEKLPSPVSLNSIAREFEIRSHKTVFHYLELFEKLFILKNLYFIDPNKTIEVYYKERKIHLTDPFLYDVFSEWCHINKPDKPRIVESVVATHLARRFRVGYWRNKTEIDVVLLDMPLGFEVKWGEKTELYKRSIGKIKNIVHLTREEFSDQPLAVPTSIFLGCLNL